MRASRLVALLSLALALPAAVLAAPSAEATTSQCQGAFCVSFDRLTYDAAHPATITSLSALPVDAQLVAVNSSANLSSNPDLWLKRATFDFGSGATPGLTITPPSDLPLGTVVAGTNASATSCSAGADGSNFKDSCPAGYGNGLATVLNSPLHSGQRNVSYGIARIVNSTTPGGAETYQATLKYFIPNASALGAYAGSTTVDLAISHPSAKVTRFTMPTSFTVDLATAFPGATADMALSVVRLRLRGLATETSAGTAISPAKTLIQQPDTCSTAAGNATLVDRASTVISLPYTFSVGGCPAAPKGVTVQPRRFAPDSVDVAGKQPTSPISGRTAHLLWDLGDGTTSTDLALGHTYSSAAPRTITVTSVDNLGAMSTPVSVQVLGSKMTVTQGSTSTITGMLTDDTGATPVGGEFVTIYRCATPDATLDTCSVLTTTVTEDDGSFGYVAPASPKAVPLAFVYDGAESTAYYSARFGAVSRLSSKPTPKVTLKAADTTIKKGTSAKLSGTVTPVLAGSPVQVQQYKNGAWKTIATKTLSSTSTYSLKASCPSKATYKYRTKIAATSTTLASVSPVLKVTAS